MFLEIFFINRFLATPDFIELSPSLCTHPLMETVFEGAVETTHQLMRELNQILLFER